MTLWELRYDSLLRLTIILFDWTTGTGSSLGRPQSTAGSSYIFCCSSTRTKFPNAASLSQCLVFYKMSSCHVTESWNEPIAIVGFSFQFPGGGDTAESFWEALVERRSTAHEASKERYSADSLCHPDISRHRALAFRGGHFLTHDVAKFDAPSFNISDTEAATLDPQQRGLLETSYRSLENGMSISYLY